MPSRAFQADPSAERRTVELDGLTLIFHRPSGITHIVTAPVPEMLAALEEGPANVAMLVDRLADRHGIAAGVEAEAIIAARLAELEAIGLVSRA
jgi:PqqD family protein of HPr-rel-A system